MKKKLIGLLTAGALACSMAVAAVACGDDNTDGAVGAKSEKVSSAAAWAAAFDYTDMTNGTVCEEARITSNSQSNVMNCTHKFSGNLQQITDEYFDPDDGKKITRESYLRYENNVCFSYEYDEEKKEWNVESYQDDDPYSIHNRMNGYDRFIDELTITDKYLSDRYDEFEYDEKNGVYVLTFDELKFEFEHEEIAESYTYADVKFTVFISGGKVTVGTLRFEEVGEGAEENSVQELTYRLTDIGSTKITLPNV